MCGVTGYLGGAAVHGVAANEALLARMANAIGSRGPDGNGAWYEAEQRIGFAHRRLAVIDLSSAGHQPMQSASGRYMFTFNGEIYNHLALRQEMEACALAPQWRGHSDTETLLAGFDAWGIGATVARAVGMFAFAVWDRAEKILVLGRDRIGEKPLYYGWQGEGAQAVFLFGSELKAIRLHPAFGGEIDRGALSLQLRHNHVPAPYSIYKNILKLPAGCLLTVSLAERSPRITPYWSLHEIARDSPAHPAPDSERDMLDRLEGLLMDAVRGQMAADVPLGAFLSGGIDSSAIVALMQAQASRPVKTFTIGFHEADYNEAVHAKAVARHLGTDHTELYVSAQQAMDIIPQLPALYDEPFSDSSQIPTFLVSQLARAQVTVALSGDGGDELFCGYERYLVTRRLWSYISKVPVPLRALLIKFVLGVPPQNWNLLAGRMRRFLPQALKKGNIGHKLHKGAELLESRSYENLYLNLVSNWNDPASVVIDGHDLPTVLNSGRQPPSGRDLMDYMMEADLLTYLPDDILVKVDRAAMGVSLETRMPFLDHRVVEFASRLPLDTKLKNGQTKWALRQILYRHVPPALIERPKMGFTVPIAAWLRGPLRDWAESLLSAPRLQSEGYFHADQVRQRWEEHLSGRCNWDHFLWNILMFNLWLESHAAAELQRKSA
ncbi:MAG: asparagine synthase (glutamine-hydrolyzing) [Pseudomonadota bacterium]